jgi:two-component sensor histidine kinase
MTAVQNKTTATDTPGQRIGEGKAAPAVGNPVAAEHRLRGLFDAIGAASRSAALGAGDVDRFAREITELTAKTVGVERVSVWFLCETGRELRSLDLYEATPNRHSEGAMIPEPQFRAAFVAFRKSRFVDAADPSSGASARLDAVIEVSGQPRGLLRLEHVGRPHLWDRDEVAFACQIADQLARSVTQRAQAVRDASLHEKEALLREVHHRVKNNLQVITSLLRLEGGRSGDQGTRAVLREMQGRILSMALLHETLYRTGDFGRVELTNYLRQLAQQLFRAHGSEGEQARLVLDLSPVKVDLDQAIPCGLIVNEMLTNSLKHGFTKGQAGEVRLSLRPEGEDQVHLEVIDDGVGLPPDFETRRGRSLGMQLIADLSRQLGGNLEIAGGPGAHFVVVFPKARVHTTGQIARPESAGP